MESTSNVESIGVRNEFQVQLTDSGSSHVCRALGISEEREAVLDVEIDRFRNDLHNPNKKQIVTDEMRDMTAPCESVNEVAYVMYMMGAAMAEWATKAKMGALLKAAMQGGGSGLISPFGGMGF